MPGIFNSKEIGVKGNSAHISATFTGQKYMIQAFHFRQPRDVFCSILFACFSNHVIIM